jgi:hypothetical protein
MRGGTAGVKLERFDWLNQTIRKERRIATQKGDEVKTSGSLETMSLDTELGTAETVEAKKQTRTPTVGIGFELPAERLEVAQLQLQSELLSTFV